MPTHSMHTGICAYMVFGSGIRSTCALQYTSYKLFTILYTIYIYRRPCVPAGRAAIDPGTDNRRARYV